MEFTIAIKKCITEKPVETVEEYIDRNGVGRTQFVGAAARMWDTIDTENTWFVMKYEINSYGAYHRENSHIHEEPIINGIFIDSNNSPGRQLNSDIHFYKIDMNSVINKKSDDKVIDYTWQAVGELLEAIAEKVREGFFQQDNYYYEDYRNTLDGYHEGRDNIRFENPEKRTEVLHIGAELEVDYLICGRATPFEELIDNIAYLKNNSIRCETDSSLDEGFEMITNPMTKDALKETLLCEYENTKDFFGKSPCTTGLHFHIDVNWLIKQRATFNRDKTDLAKLKVFTIVENIFEDSRAIDMCQRSEEQLFEDCNSYAKKAIQKEDYADKDVFEKVLKANTIMTRYERYNLVNVNNTNTVELRFFAGVLDKEYLKMAVDIAFAIAEISRKVTLGTAVSYTFAKLATYIKQNRKKYKDAYSYFVRENWI